MPAHLEEFEGSSNEVCTTVSKAGLDEVEKHLRQQLGRHTEDGDVRVLGIFQPEDLSGEKIYLFLKGVDYVFTWFINAVQPSYKLGSVR